MFRGLLAEPDCKFCPLRRSTKVPPEGNRNAKIAVVGMGPGWQEEKYGHVFIGESGQLLNRILREAGLNREDLWISNCGLCRPVAIEIDPQEGRWMPKAKVEQESILKHCRSRLLRELAVVKPKVIVAVGALTMKALTDDVEGINKIQGSLNRLTKDAGFDAIVIPVFHPAHMLRGEQRFYPTVVQGFRKAKRLADHGPKPAGRLFIIDPASPTVEKDIAKLEDLVNQVLESGEDIAVDVESTVAEPTEATLTVVGFASATRRLGVAVTVRTWNPTTGTFDFTWNAYQWHRVNAALRRLLGGSNTKWYWNFGFDVTLLERHYRLGGKVRDGMILHHLAEPDLLHGLDFAAQSYLDIPPWKYYFRKAEKAGTGTHRDLLVYNAQDALYTALLAPLLEEAARDIDNIHIEAHQLEMADMARRAHIYGIPIDLGAWRRVYNEHEQLRYAAMERMREAIETTEGAVESLNEYVQQRRNARAALSGRETIPKAIAPLTAESWNPNSGDHGCWFLYEFLRLQPQRWTKGGPDKDPAKQTPSHSYKGVLVYLSNPLVKAYVDRAEEEATLRTLDAIKNHLNPRTGRLHPSWNATGTKGTRWVSKPNCYDEETEILTTRGWVRFADLVDDDLVAQWQEGTATFVKPSSKISYHYKGDMVSVKNQFVDLLVTPDHRILLNYSIRQNFENAQIRHVVIPAGRLLKSTPYKATLLQSVETYNPVGITVHPAILSVLCAAQADGWRRKYGPGQAWAWYLSKPRKIERLREALKKCGKLASWYETPLGRRNRQTKRKPETAFYLRDCPLKQWIDTCLRGKDKTFWGEYLLTWSGETLRNFAEEVTRWDGSRNPSGTHASYASTNKENVNWAQIAAVLGGGQVGYPREFWGNHSKKPCWTLGHGNRTVGRCGIFRRNISVVPYDGVVYCVTVPTGFIVVRRNGRVSISGNCQNWDETIKEITVQPPGRCWIGADAAQIEYRVAAVLAGIPELLHLFNSDPFDEEVEEWKKYDPVYDAHSLVATEVFGDVYTNGDKKTKKALRTMVKRVVYALFYGAFPKKIYGTILEDPRVPSEFRAMITLERIERIWEGFSARFGEWEAWADNETATARATGFQSWPPFNRKHPWAMPETIEETKIRNTPIQRAAGDVVNLLFKNMDREVRARGLDAHFTLHAHDACLWDVALEHRDAMLELVNRHFDYQLQSPGGHRVHIYGQAKAGRTLAEV